MAELLSDGEVETLRHLAREGVGANTLRAMASDLAYLEAWSLAAGGAPCPGRPRERSSCVSSPTISTTASAARMIPCTACPMRSRRRCAKAGDCGPAAARAFYGAQAPGPVDDLPSLARPRGPVFVPEPARSAPPRRPHRPSAVRTQERETLDREVLERLIAACDGARLAGRRDAALLLLAFASGGRRRSEIARLKFEDLVERPPIPANPDDASGPKLPVLALRLLRSKTASREEDEREFAIGRPVVALNAWLEAAGISEGPMFRAIDRWGGDRRLRPRRAERQRHRQKALSPRRARSGGLLRPRPALGPPDRGRPARRAAAGSHAPVAPPLGAAGRGLLQRGRDRARPRGPTRLVSGELAAIVPMAADDRENDVEARRVRAPRQAERRGAPSCVPCPSARPAMASAPNALHQRSCRTGVALRP